MLTGQVLPHHPHRGPAHAAARGRADPAVLAPGAGLLHRPYGEDSLRAQRRAPVPVVFAATIADSFPAFLDAGGRPAVLPLGRLPRAASSVSGMPRPGCTRRPGWRCRPTWRTRRRPARTSPATTTRSPGWTREIGRMVAELERRKLRDNTLVVFLSDNGAPFPREKGTLYDSGTRTPLIFSWPRVIRAGHGLRPGSREHRGSWRRPSWSWPGAGRRGRCRAKAFAALLDRSRRRTPAASTSSASATGTTATSTSGPCAPVRFKLIRTDAYTALPLCTAADIGASPSFQALRARARAGRLTAAQRRLFEAPRARLELYDLAADPWELRNVADDPGLRGTRCASWRGCCRSGWRRRTTFRRPTGCGTTTPIASPACRSPPGFRHSGTRRYHRWMNGGDVRGRRRL